MTDPLGTFTHSPSLLNSVERLNKVVSSIKRKLKLTQEPLHCSAHNVH